MSKRIRRPYGAPLERVAAWLHENEPVRNLRTHCVESASGRFVEVADAMRALEQANRARYIPRVGWVTNFVTGDKCAELTQAERIGFGWYVRHQKGN